MIFDDISSDEQPQGSRNSRVSRKGQCVKIKFNVQKSKLRRNSKRPGVVKFQYTIPHLLQCPVQATLSNFNNLRGLFYGITEAHYLNT